MRKSSIVPFDARTQDRALVIVISMSAFFLTACSDHPAVSIAGTGGIVASNGGQRLDAAATDTGTGGSTSTGGSAIIGGVPAQGGEPATGGIVRTGGEALDATPADATIADAAIAAIADAVRDVTSTGGTAGQSPITIWMAGDSTVMTYAAGNTDGTNGAELEGWGQEIGQYFNSKVTVSNQAIGGRSIGFFMWQVVRDSAGTYQCVDTQGTPKYQLDASGNKIDNTQWARIKAGIKAGDFLLVQFGHNDETHTCPRYVGLADYKTYLGFMADTVAAMGATAIFVTPMGHRAFSGTTVNNTLLPYANAMKDEAKQKKIELEDLNLRSVEYFAQVGDAYLTSDIFDGGSTHFIKAGAVKMAGLIVGEIKKNKGPLSAYLK